MFLALLVGLSLPVDSKIDWINVYDALYSKTLVVVASFLHLRTKRLYIVMDTFILQSANHCKALAPYFRQLAIYLQLLQRKNGYYFPGQG